MSVSMAHIFAFWSVVRCGPWNSTRVRSGALAIQRMARSRTEALARMRAARLMPRPEHVHLPRGRRGPGGLPAVEPRGVDRVQVLVLARVGLAVANLAGADDHAVTDGALPRRAPRVGMLRSRLAFREHVIDVHG